MSSKVYFAGVRARAFKESKVVKVKKLLKKFSLKDLLEKDGLTAVKVHFGERGNDTFMSPVLVRAVVDEVIAAGGKPFVTDTNTLYKGSRHNAVDHLLTALEHGFGFATINAPLIIADGLRGHTFQEVPLPNGKHFKKVKVAEAIHHAKSMLVLSHFKGHMLGGFGGALKNLAMGCTPGQGKKDQHASRFHCIEQKCTACGACVPCCPEDAISFIQNAENKKKTFIDKDKCVGCGECMTMCRFGAIAIDFATELGPFNERMAEYALGVCQGKQGRVAYVNFLLNITPDCDCASWSDAPMVPDIGILASTDPVALDKACFDLVNAQTGFADSMLKKNHAPGQDKFKGAWDYSVGEVLLDYAQGLGIGSTDYELVKI